MIHFAHVNWTRNAGDQMSGPYHWFDFGAHTVGGIRDPIPRGAKAVVYGGGALVNWLARAPQIPGVKRVAWGVGSTVHGQERRLPNPEGFDLLGIRDTADDALWVPCASCMSPLFDRDYPIEREAALFVNADENIRRRYPVAVGGLPVLDNERSMEEVIAWLGSAETVVTDSYHGVFWATLLGRRVVCLPYSSKFYGFRHPPAYSADRGLDWRALEAQTWPTALDECRDRTRRFHRRVGDLLAVENAA